MAGGSIFDSSFQTAIPQLNTEKQLMAMLMRDNALNFKPVIDSLKGVGKVFSDAEDTLKKANTSAAKRYLENMSWEDRLALEKKGDPLMTLAQEGIPLDLADAELNKAYSDSRTKARKDKTADWVATKLPMIGYNDWVSYMKGDNPYLFSSYGVDEDMDFVNNPDLRKAVEDSMQNNANRFLMDFDASHNITPEELVKLNKTADQLRYERATEKERSILAKANKELSTTLQDTTNTYADQLRQRERLINRSDTNFENAGKFNVNGSNTQGTDSQESFKAYIDDISESFINSWIKAHTDPTHTLYQDYANSNDVEGYINAMAEANPTLFDNSLGIDNKVLQKEVINKLKSMDFDSRIHDDVNQTLSIKDPSLIMDEYKRLKQFAPNTAERRKGNTINRLTDIIRKSLTEEEQKQLENPNFGITDSIATKLRKDLASHYKLNEDSDTFKEFFEPAIKQALAGRQEIAQRDANAELTATTKTVKDNLTRLGQSQAVRLLTGNGYGPEEVGELEGAILNKTNIARINKHKNGIRNLLSQDSKNLYDSASAKGQDVILCLALATAFNGNISNWDDMDDKERDKWLTNQDGYNLVADEQFKKTVEYVSKAFPRSLYDKKKGTNEDK